MSHFRTAWSRGMGSNPRKNGTGSFSQGLGCLVALQRHNLSTVCAAQKKLTMPTFERTKAVTSAICKMIKEVFQSWHLVKKCPAEAFKASFKGDHTSRAASKTIFPSLCRHGWYVFRETGRNDFMAAQRQPCMRPQRSCHKLHNKEVHSQKNV